MCFLSTNTSGRFAQRRNFTAGAPEWRRFRLSIGEGAPKKIVQKGSVRVDRKWYNKNGKNGLIFELREHPLPPFSVHVSIECRFSDRGAPVAEATASCATSPPRSGELNTFLFLIHLDDWQAVDAENGGDFAAVMDVVFEHTPDDLLARN